MADIVSERYALSLYELAQAEGKEQLFLEQLRGVGKVFELTPGLAKLLTTPSIALADKHEVLKNGFDGKVEPLLMNFLLLITEKGRAGLLPDMVCAYEAHYREQKGIVAVRAISAVPLSDALRDKLKDKLCKVVGKQIELVATVDPSLLGGLVIKINNEQFDVSLRTRLNELAAQLRQTIA